MWAWWFEAVSWAFLRSEASGHAEADMSMGGEPHGACAAEFLGDCASEIEGCAFFAYGCAELDVDTIEYTYPSKYFLEFTPEKTEIKTEFGYFKSEIIPSDGKMVYIRKFSLNKGRFPKEG